MAERLSLRFLIKRVALLLAALLAGPFAHAATDVAGSRDPLAIPRFPHAWIVTYSRDEAIDSRDFIVGRVERRRGAAHADQSIRIEGAIETAIYRIPEGNTVADVAEHFRAVVSGQLRFECGARDCGRSNEWANQIFRQALLYGPDGNQRYLAWEQSERFVSVYLIERGNRRIYAHVQVITPVASLGSGTQAGQVGVPVVGDDISALLTRGWMIVPDVLPEPDGSLPAEAAERLRGLAARLPAGASPLYIVCHLRQGDLPVPAQIEAATRCAATAASELGAALPPDAGFSVQPFGAGPLLPRPGVPDARIELVLPSGLR